MTPLWMWEEWEQPIVQEWGGFYLYNAYMRRIILEFER